MSLMQLLAMGKSIGTIQDRPTPYKMRQQNLLPKFGVSSPESVRYDNGGTVEPSPGRSDGATVRRSDSTTGLGVSSEPAAEDTKAVDTGSSPSQSESARTSRAASLAPQPSERTSGPRSVAFPLGRWTALKKPLEWKSRGKGGPPVQTELGLDMVKVVRNDLSESDLEVVSAKVSPEVAIKSGRVLWRQLCTRWFRWGRA